MSKRILTTSIRPFNHHLWFPPPSFLLPCCISRSLSSSPSTSHRSSRPITFPSRRPYSSSLASASPSSAPTPSTLDLTDAPGLLSSSSPSSTLPLSRASSRIRVEVPTPEVIKSLEEDGMEIELTPLEEANIVLTESACEQLTRIAKREKDPTLRFRIAVESGGCHGYQYKMDLTNDIEPDDYTFYPSPSSSSSASDDSSSPPIPIIIDATSLTLLKGATLDFATELIGSAFRIGANPQAKGSGCGCGVSWEAKE